VTEEEIKSFRDILDNMSYTPLYPDWYYSSVHIDNLTKIKEELINLQKNAEDRLQRNKFYTNILKNTVYKHCPLLKKYLHDVGLDQKFHRVLISTDVVSNSALFVHVDSYNPHSTTHSLNIPLLDCDDSFTAWYRTGRKKLNDCLKTGMDPIINYADLPISEAEEIKRLQYSSGGAALVNTTILHKGISNRKTRMIAGLRFSPELTDDDIRKMGVKSPHVQEGTFQY